MRYYRVVIRDKQGNVLIPNYNGRPGFTPVPYSASLSTYTSLNAGTTPLDQGSANPGALRVEVDIALTAMDAALPASFVRIHGVGLAEINQASNLTGFDVEVYGGMSKGLPLANPAQSGLIARGQVFKAFGNWIGVDQYLEIYVGTLGSSTSSSDVTGQPGKTLAPTTTLNAPANLTFQWKAGQPLMQPLVSMLQVAYPQYSVVGAVHEGLLWSGATATGYFSTLGQFAEYINQKSLSMISGYAPDQSPGSYPGVALHLFNDTLVVSDGTTQTTPKAIQFIELVGQPSWVDSFKVQCMCPMRADIHVSDYVTLPPNIPGITSSASNSQFFPGIAPNNPYTSQKSGSIFSGTFQVTDVRHVGDSRDASSAGSWVTTLTMNLAYSGPSTVVQKLPTVVKGS